ncbi:MAG: hypothetical protein ACT4O0_10245 [Pseudonocardia sp.]
MPASAAFLPLTLGVLAELPEPARDRQALADAANRVESGAWETWHALLGGCSCPVRVRLPSRLQRLSGAVRTATGPEWWDGPGRSHRDRTARYQRWLTEALADGDGAGFAEAFAGYDAALAHAMLGAVPETGRTGAVSAGADAPTGRVGTDGAHSYGTMTGWARQARAATSRAHRVMHRAVSPLSWAPLTWTTNRPATDSSRWSRRSRSAG